MKTGDRASATVPASTSNLGPGFDTLGMAISLYIQVEVTCTEEPTSIQVKGVGASQIPSDERNVVYRAAARIFKMCGYHPLPNVRITVDNAIPPERGLGGSGAAILGGVLATNALCGFPLSDKQIINLATDMDGHPDNIAPSFYGGLVVACATDAEVLCIPVSCPSEIKTVCLIPDFQLPTEKARAVLPETVSFADAVFNISHVALCVAAFCSGELGHLQVATQDRLHQDYRASLIPGLKEMFDAAYDAGALAVMLSGAGSSVIALCVDQPETIAQQMYRVLMQQQMGGEVQILDVDRRGARVTKQP